MLGYCPTCHDVMSSTALDFHRSQHDPLGRPFKCNHGCIMHYFATFDDRQHHLSLMHGVDDDLDVKPEMSDVKLVKSSMLAIRNIASSSTGYSSNTSKVTETKLSSKHASSTPMTCTICEKVTNKSNMHSHMRLHDKTDRPLECVLGCRSTYFKTEEALQTHNYRNHRSAIESKGVYEETVACTVCDRTMGKSRIPLHMCLHDSCGRPFACESGCPTTYFKSRSDLVNHMRNVHDVYSSKCNVCHKSNVGRADLHMRLHDSTGRPFQCKSGCTQTFFESPKALGDHIRQVHNVKGESKSEFTSCTVCGTELLTRNMKLHMVMHKNEKKMVDIVDKQIQLPKVAPTVPTTADQQSETNGMSSLTSPVNRPFVKEMPKPKVSGNRRSIIGTPTVQMSMKMEPSTSATKQAQREVRPPSPPMYDQPDNQGVNHSKPLSLSAINNVDGVAQHSGSLDMPSIIPSERFYFNPAKRPKLSKYDDGSPDQDGRENFSSDESSDDSSAYSPSSKKAGTRTDRRQRRRSYQWPTKRLTLPTNQNNVVESDHNDDADDPRADV